MRVRRSPECLSTAATPNVMNLTEPPFSPDDTQPTRPTLGDTQPLPVVRPDRSRWMLLAVMLLSSLSLMATVALAVSLAGPSASEVPQEIPITLVVGTEQRDLLTQARSVDALLAEEGVLLGPDDALSPPADTALTPNMVVTVARARAVQVSLDDDTWTVRTPFELPFDVLNAAGVMLADGDRVWIDGQEVAPGDVVLWPLPVSEIRIMRAAVLTIVDGGSSIEHRTTAETIGEALYEAGITLYLSDLVEPDLSAPILDDVRVTIRRAQPVTIEVDGTALETRVQGRTVGDALAEAGVALIGMDYAIPGDSSPIVPGMTIRVLRVTEEIITEEEELPYETIFQADASMELDTRQVVQAGQTGLRRILTRVNYENGYEISRSPAGEELVREVQNEVVAYGTNIVLRTIDTPEGPREYWRKLRVYATSYHPAALGGDNITSIGETLRKGIVAADPGIIRYGTSVFVPGYGTGVIADTGGPRSSRYWIDLGYSDEDYQSWSRYVDIYLLAPVPANITYLLPAWRPLAGR